ncbi:MAG: type IV pilus assembly protein PilM, partial [Candidatus Omnitrophica bacterium]|nr:type IV pilus assembly protein PilM [Candidatus Omnitrophota bacterium]
MAREVIVGLDVGNRSVKVIQLAKQKNSYSLLNAAMGEFDHKADEKSRIAVIKKVIKQNRIKMKEVNISIEGPSVIIRNIEFPKMSRDELKRAIKFEAEKYIPYKVSEVVLDCEILKESENNMTVLLAAAKKDFVYTKINFIRKAGLEPWIVDIGSFALINAFNLNAPRKEKTIALINVGDRITNVNIVNDGVLVF